MEIKIGSTVSLSDSALAIAECGDTNTFYLRGEPGIGKSMILASLTSTIYNPDAPLAASHLGAYVDCSDKELGDLTIPFPDKENGCTRYLPNSILNIHTRRPLVIMLDEIGKAPQPIRNMLLPLMNERRLGDTPLHPKSRVFATGNLTSDGVGDVVKAHELNRVTELIVRKPNSDEWLSWAMRRNDMVLDLDALDKAEYTTFNVNAVKIKINEVLMTWVKQYPHCLDSYLNDPSGRNPYIYNPARQQKAFVSPRSLEKASNILNKRDKLGPDLTIACLIGTIGESAARDMHAFVGVADMLVPYEDIIFDPKGVKVPSDAVAMIIQVYQFLSRVVKTELSNLMDYIERLPKETQSLFATSLASTPNKKAWALQNQKFVNWARKNSYLFT